MKWRMRLIKNSRMGEMQSVKKQNKTKTSQQVKMNFLTMYSTLSSLLVVLSYIPIIRIPSGKKIKQKRKMRNEITKEEKLNETLENKRSKLKQTKTIKMNDKNSHEN